MQLIDRGALLQANMFGNTAPITHRTYAESIIQKAPIIDAVPVVRCRDCKNGRDSEGGRKFDFVWCEKWHNVMRGCDFCSFGKRRGGECQIR